MKNFHIRHFTSLQHDAKQNTFWPFSENDAWKITKINFYKGNLNLQKSNYGNLDQRSETKGD